MVRFGPLNFGHDRCAAALASDLGVWRVGAYRCLRSTNPFKSTVTLPTSSRVARLARPDIAKPGRYTRARLS